MEVKKIPLSGCFLFITGIFTFGLAPLVIWLSERNWPKYMDEQGLTTRGGKEIDWTDFEKITKVHTQVNRGSISVERYELRHSRGKVDVVIYRLENGEQIFDFIWKHLSERVRNPQ